MQQSHWFEDRFRQLLPKPRHQEELGDVDWFGGGVHNRGIFHRIAGDVQRAGRCRDKNNDLRAMRVRVGGRSRWCAPGDYALTVHLQKVFGATNAAFARVR